MTKHETKAERADRLEDARQERLDEAADEAREEKRDAAAAKKANRSQTEGHGFAAPPATPPAPELTLLEEFDAILAMPMGGAEEGQARVEERHAAFGRLRARIAKL
jgi:hypothetical protein